jgi:hypothetical protein
VDFYDEVLRELMLALGAALFLANAYALVRRRSDAGSAGSPANAKRRGDSGSDTDLQQAPVVRSVTYMLIGLVVAAWALVSMIAS